MIQGGRPLMLPRRWDHKSDIGLYDFLSLYGIEMNDPCRVEYEDGEHDTIRNLEDIDNDYLPIKMSTLGERPIRFLIGPHFEYVEVAP